MISFPVVKLALASIFSLFLVSPISEALALSTINVQMLGVFLEQLKVQILATESSDANVRRLVGEVLVGDLARALLGISLVERLRLVELLAVLGSVLIGVEVLLSGPGGSIPQGRVHRVARAVVV